ncbi:alveolin domain containing intermediate filament IMC5 [Besnoitia besnoiti]|uniref:Alveolin domain containing intermediate filament IMC5 n=1 Tax=Besnoitia besnoiti TaxID=94643 RepID=A0A2A9MI52_BESBE|nr:alveolin domain containing intermediate filament IMC5 [Besnoitia besnoiti]PFH35323.1 alveolin domain containing intermediate filament IMC5 [Besnoitia besnoiti]
MIPFSPAPASPSPAHRGSAAAALRVAPDHPRDGRLAGSPQAPQSALGASPRVASPPPVRRSLCLYGGRHKELAHTSESSSIEVPLALPAHRLRPLRYRCPSDTVTLDTGAHARGYRAEAVDAPGRRLYPAPPGSDPAHRPGRAPVSMSSPAVCGPASLAGAPSPVRLHCPSLASVNSVRSPSVLSEDLLLTGKTPGESSPPSAVFNGGSDALRKAPFPHGNSSATFSPSSLARILDAAAAEKNSHQSSNSVALPPSAVNGPPAVSVHRASSPVPGLPLSPQVLVHPSPPAAPTMNASAVSGGVPPTPAAYAPAAGVASASTPGPDGPRIHPGIAGSGIVVAPPTPRGAGGSQARSPVAGSHLLAPPAPRAGPPVETSSTHDRQWVAVTAYRPVDVVTKTVEVPVTRTVDVLVPKPVIKEKIVEVPKFVPHYVEKILEVPEIEWVDRVIEVPEYFYSTKYVPKVEIQENIIERPVYQDKWVEKVVEVARVEEIVRYRDIVEAEEVIKYIPKGHSEEEWRGAPIFSVPPEHAPPLPPKWVTPGAAAPPPTPAYCSPDACVGTPIGAPTGQTPNHADPRHSSFPPPASVIGGCPASQYWTPEFCRAGNA